MAQLQDVLDKLSKPARLAFENAMKSAKLRGNPYVELVHWIEQMALTDGADIQRIEQFFGIDAGALGADLTRAVDRLDRGATSISAISEHIDSILSGAWNEASQRFGSPVLRSGHVLYAGLKSRELSMLLMGMSPHVRPDRRR